MDLEKSRGRKKIRPKRSNKVVDLENGASIPRSWESSGSDTEPEPQEDIVKRQDAVLQGKDTKAFEIDLRDAVPPLKRTERMPPAFTFQADIDPEGEVARSGLIALPKKKEWHVTE